LMLNRNLWIWEIIGMTLVFAIVVCAMHLQSLGLPNRNLNLRSAQNRREQSVLTTKSGSTKSSTRTDSMMRMWCSMSLWAYRTVWLTIAISDSPRKFIWILCVSLFRSGHLSKSRNSKLETRNSTNL
jgi:hypothetical protein